MPIKQRNQTNTQQFSGFMLSKLLKNNKNHCRA